MLYKLLSKPIHSFCLDNGGGSNPKNSNAGLEEFLLRWNDPLLESSTYCKSEFHVFKTSISRAKRVF